MKKKNSARIWLLMLIGLILGGCGTSMVTLPATEPTAEKFSIKGRVEYEGNRAYLPATIVECKDPAEPGCDLLFRYRYSVAYGKDKVPELLPLFNPFTLVGFPVGEDTLLVHGLMEAYRGEEKLKTYEATCALDRHSSIFLPGDTYTEMRKKGLDAVKQNIENQMCADRGYFLELSEGKIEPRD